MEEKERKIERETEVGEREREKRELNTKIKRGDRNLYGWTKVYMGDKNL